MLANKEYVDHLLAELEYNNVKLTGEQTKRYLEIVEILLVL